MKTSELKSEIKDYIYEILSEENIAEAGEKTAFVKGTIGSQAIEYKDESELQSLKDNPDVKGITTAAGKKIKEAIKKVKMMEEGEAKKQKVAALKNIVSKLKK